MEIRYVAESDKVFWFGLDRHLSEDMFAIKVRDKQGYVLVEADKPVALLRYNLFWDNTLFCTMLYVNESKQRQGYGRALMLRWENDMRDQGYGMVMVSTQVDENAQHFYRKIGYKDCGGFTVDIPGYEQPMELMMNKKL